MSRVMKRFLLKIGKILSIVVYTVASLLAGAFIFDQLGLDPELGMFVSSMILIIFPIVVWMIKDMWHDAKREVEWENKEMMRSLKGEHY